jgi:ABC-type antimicrobial peptide transport system permease subunit
LARGYCLTDEDAASINDYIKNLKQNAVLKLEDNVVTVDNVRKFVPTEEGNIKKTEGGFSLIKSRLALKHAFKIGASSLKHKKFRLVLTIFLSFIAFTMFGLSDTIGAYDSYTTTLNSLADSKIDYAAYSKRIQYNEGDYTYFSVGKISDDDIQKLKDDTGINIKGVYSSLFASNTSLYIDKMLDGNKVNSSNLYASSFAGVCELTQDDVNSYGYTLDGTIPNGAQNQIVITDYMFDYIRLSGGIYTVDDSAQLIFTEVNNHSDLIGKKLAFGSSTSSNIPNEFIYEVTGIMDTHLDLSSYPQNTADVTNIIDYIKLEELHYMQSYSPHALLYVGDGYIQRILSASKSQYGTTISNYGSIDISSSSGISLNNPTYMLDYANADKDRVITISEKSSLSSNEVLLPSSSIFDIIKSTYRDYTLRDDELAYAKAANISATTISDYIADIYALANYKYADSVAVGQTITAQMLADIYSPLYSAYSNLSDAYYSPDEYKGIQAIFSDDDGNKVDLNFYTLGAAYGQTYTLEDSYLLADIIAVSKYVANNIDDARAYAQQNSSYYSTLPDLLKGYYNHIRVDIMGASTSELTPSDKAIYDSVIQLSKDVKKQCITAMNQRNQLSYLEVYVRTSQGKYKSFIVDVVGVYESTFKNSAGTNSSSNTIVLSDDIATALIGKPSEIYQFAVGPLNYSDRSQLAKCVDAYNNISDDGVQYYLNNSVVRQLGYIDDILAVLGQVFLYMGLAFCLFAALMLSNFIATSVAYKKQEIGILRAIGSRSSDVFKIFFAESFIIAMINFALASIATGIFAAFINQIIRENVGILITILSFSIRQVALILGVSLLVAIIATFLPVKKIASKKPIDAIRNR